jgi:L-rhamnose isomerase
MLEEIKSLPIGPIWDYYCQKSDVPVGDNWIKDVKDYEKKVTSKRQ